MDETTQKRLMEIWDKRAGYVSYGGITYQVLTPDGPERPLFIRRDDRDYYGETSTGMVKAPDPVTVRSEDIQKRAKPGGLTRNPKLTDVGK